METLKRYARVYVACVRNCLARELEFRTSFALTVGTSLFSSTFSMVLAGLVFTNVPQVAGWDLDRMFVLTGTFLIVRGLSTALFMRNMQRLTDMVNKGELDFILTRPISSQFLVSTRYVQFASLPTAVVGAGYVVIGIARLGIVPGPVEVAGFVLMVACALLSFYALSFISVTGVLWTGRINNIASAMDAVTMMGRMPSDVYRGVMRLLLTYTLPIAAIATLPSKAILGVLEPGMAPYQVTLTAGLLWASHRFWRFSLRRYTSASS